MNIKIVKWKNSLAIKIPKQIADEGKIAEGDEVKITAINDRIVITPCKLKYTLEQLLEGMSKENLHDEVDWGKPVGRENIFVREDAKPVRHQETSQSCSSEESNIQ